jgi:voltage-gated potassium channel
MGIGIASKHVGEPSRFPNAHNVLLETLRQGKWAVGYFVALTCVSTLIFSYVEKHTLFDAFYWTSTVFGTFGFGDITPHTMIGKLLFVFDAISGITTYIYLITGWQTSLIKAKLQRKLWHIAETQDEKRCIRHATSHRDDQQEEKTSSI